MDLPRGTRLGAYEIVDQLGSGGMGTVFRAFDTQLHRPVAIKLLRDTPRVAGASQRLVLHEARAASALNHPNVCTVYEIGEFDGNPYIVMEYIEGRTLQDLLAQDRLPIDRALRIGVQIADALAHAHDHHIVHRDLKSSNVAVTPEVRAKVLDFGIASRIVAAGTGDLTASSTGPFDGKPAGTLAYMAPEVIRGGAADSCADIWSLGVLLYEMVAGRLPFGGRTPVDLASSIVRDAPSALPERVPPTLRAIIERCLEKEPGERYHRASEVRAALETALAEFRTGGSAIKPKRPRWVLPATAAVGLTVVVAIGLMTSGMLHDRARPGGDGVRVSSIAVLPLQNLSRDPEQEFFADGMTDALITSLSKIRALRVISRLSVMRFKDTQTRLSEIANELHVDAIVEGSIMRSGNRVRINAQLTEAATDRNIWADSYERDLQDALALQSEVARVIAEEIKITVTPEERASLAAARRVDPAAHELYLKGRQQVDKRTRDAFGAAIQLFQRAIEIDSSFAEAYCGLADAYALNGYFGFSPPMEAYARAKSAAKRSLEINDTLAEGHATLAMATFFSWEWNAAEPEFKRAIELNPSFAHAQHWYSHYLVATNRMAESLDASRKALALEPLNANIAAHLAWAYYYARQYDEAVEQSRRTLELDPGYYQGYLFRGMARIQQGRPEEAISDLKAAVALPNVPVPQILAYLGLAYVTAGQPDDAREVLARFQKESKDFAANPDLAVLTYTALGDRPRALELLERAFSLHSGPLINIAVEPAYEPLRTETRYRQLVRRMGLAR